MGVKPRACFTAKRILRNLHFVVDLLLRESLLPQGTEFYSEGRCCLEVMEEWGTWASKQAEQMQREKERLIFGLAVKGTKKIFDVACRTCDKKNAQAARQRWLNKMCAVAEPRTDPAVLADIRRRTRKILGEGKWAKGIRRDGDGDKVYIPDQQGCLELERGCGGTLSVPRWDRPPIEVPTLRGEVHIVRETLDVDTCRIGVAKTKGKFRVVTMQGAYAKRVLRPIHDAAYDFISLYPWLVRGDVTSEIMEDVIADRREGECYISGDYEASTDNLNRDAVFAVVEVMAEALKGEEKRVLLESFEKVYVGLKKGKREVRRGSMMGNLCSFVVLCILNRIAYERARTSIGEREDRKCGINGDDFLCAGGDEMWDAWRRCTADVGFVVNEKKSGRSTRWLELNSHVYDAQNHKFLRKLCFGFLGSADDQKDTLAKSVFDLANQLSFSTSAFFLCSRVARDVLSQHPIPVSVVPSRWWRLLIKRWWFRRILLHNCEGRVPTIAVGRERKLPFTYGPLVKSEFVEEVDEAAAIFDSRVKRAWVEAEEGRVAMPMTKGFRKQTLIGTRGKTIRMKRGVRRWVRLWLAPTLQWIKDAHGEVLEDENFEGEWAVDQSGLDVVMSWEAVPKPGGWAPPLSLLRHAVRPDGVDFV